jgi:hypothetical protein
VEKLFGATSHWTTMTMVLEGIEGQWRVV